MKLIRILVAKGEGELQRVLPEVLKSGGIECIGVVTTIDDLIATHESTRPDVVVMDVRFESALRGRTAATRLRDAQPGVRIVLCSPYDSHDLFMRRIESAAQPGGVGMAPLVAEVQIRPCVLPI